MSEQKPDTLDTIETDSWIALKNAGFEHPDDTLTAAQAHTIMIEFAEAVSWTDADELTDLKQTFDLQQKADERAIKQWQEKHPDKPNTWPDRADMVGWLMERHTALLAVAEAAEATLRQTVDLFDTAGNGRCGVCGVGYRLFDTKGNLQTCDWHQCLSHKWRELEQKLAAWRKQG